MTFFFVPFKVNSKAAESLADPAEYPNLFEDWQIALNVEATVAPKRYLLVLMVLCII
jgi:coatomer subunit beta'